MTIRVVITFGQEDKHTISSVTYDSDVVAVFQAKNIEEGKQLAQAVFASEWSAIYTEDEFINAGLIKYYIGGFIKVNF